MGAAGKGQGHSNSPPAISQTQPSHVGVLLKLLTARFFFGCAHPLHPWPPPAALSHSCFVRTAKAIVSRYQRAELRRRLACCLPALLLAAGPTVFADLADRAYWCRKYARANAVSAAVTALLRRRLPFLGPNPRLSLGKGVQACDPQASAAGLSLAHGGQTRRLVYPGMPGAHDPPHCTWPPSRQVALRKILKKYDKLCGGQRGRSFLQHCWQLPTGGAFLHSPLLDELKAIQASAGGRLRRPA